MLARDCFPAPRLTPLTHIYSHIEQVAANYIVKYTFELGGVCVTADYQMLEDGSGVSVHNAQNLLKPNGTTTAIDGQASARNASEPGKLTVTFDKIPFPGSYWVIKLGPIKDGEYQYSVVTDAYGTLLGFCFLGGGGDGGGRSARRKGVSLPCVHLCLCAYGHGPSISRT